MHNYLLGIMISLFLFCMIGVIAGRKIKNTNDYYVAGRRAPVILIVGSLIASFLSTGAFMGDTGEVYNGFFMGIVIVGIIQASGYVYGAGLFGKYIRRAKVNTVPEYFGKRFTSMRLRRLASFTLIIAVAAYLLSAIQGVSTLLQFITGWDYRICVLIAWLSFTLFTVYSGSMGVLITDTIMFIIFLFAALIGIPYIVRAAGGWNNAIFNLANSTTNPGIIAWTNNLNYMYPTGMQNLIWAVVYGVVWGIVVMVSPWQTSRYLMAKDENVVMRSSVWASMGVVTVTMALYFSAAFVYSINPNLADSSTSIIWAAMNCMPTIIGIVMVTGILSAGISSASTFLSLIGSSLMNDIIVPSKMNISEKDSLKYSRIVMAITSLIVLVIAIFNPPQIFWIMYFGGTVIASSWGLIAILSVWKKNMSESGAFYGMLLGFLGCAVPKALTSIYKITLPIYLDPFFIGIVLSFIGIVIGNAKCKVSEENVQYYEMLHTQSSVINGDDSNRKTYRLTKVYGVFSICLGAFFVIFYALPYTRSII